MSDGAIELAGSFLRRLRGGLDAGLDLPEALARSTSTMPRGLREAAGTARSRMAGEYLEDEWGFDEEFAEMVEPFLDFLYDHWWRVQVTGIENVPSHGGALLAANHAGILPWDGTMISISIMRNHPLPRPPRFLVLNWAFELPFVSVALRKLGGVVASPHNALRLLQEDHLVAVFPEGVKGTGKPFADRYRLQRFGRGGFVELALRAGTPIVPVAIVGSEEIYPKLGESPLLARLTGAPFFPLTPTFPWLGPLGVVPLPAKWRIEFCPPIETESLGPNAADNRLIVMELAERVRDTIQKAIYRNLVRRGGAYI